MGLMILEIMDHEAFCTSKQWALMPAGLPHALVIEDRLKQSEMAPDTEIIAQ
jgi:hypothetical protein